VSVKYTKYLLISQFFPFFRALILTLIGSGVFHSVLFFVPNVQEVQIQPQNMTFEFTQFGALMEWSNCPTYSDKSFVCPNWIDQQHQKNDPFQNLKLENCEFECNIEVGVCEAVTNMFLCQTNGTSVDFENVNITRSDFNGQIENLDDESCPKSAEVQLLMTNGKPLTLAPYCKLTCSKVVKSEKFARCDVTQGNRTVTNVLYFIFR
jgi:hypothetical protein